MTFINLFFYSQVVLLATVQYQNIIASRYTGNEPAPGAGCGLSGSQHSPLLYVVRKSSWGRVWLKWFLTPAATLCK